MTLIPNAALGNVRLFRAARAASLVSAVGGFILAAYLTSKAPLTYWWALILLPYLFWSTSFVLIVICKILVDVARSRGILHIGILPLRLTFAVGFAALGVGIYLHLRLKRSLKKHEELEAKVRACDKLSKSNPNSPEVYLKRADAYLHLGQVERCMQDLATMMSLDPDHPLSHYYRCCRNWQLGRTKAAMEEFSQLRKTAGSKYRPFVVATKDLMSESKGRSGLEAERRPRATA